MCPALFAIGAAGFAFLGNIGRLTETVGERQCSYPCIHKVMECSGGIHKISDSAAGAKGVKYIPHI